MRPRLRSESRPQAGRRGGALERVRLRRHERDPRVPEVPPVAPFSLTAPDSSAAEQLGNRLGHRFEDPTLLARALTHPSYANEHPPERDNESLAFLGDAVLGLVVAEHLLEARPDAAVGILTPRRADVVSGANLARWAEQIGLGRHVRLGRGEQQSGGQGKESVLATALEAVIGVVYLEGGMAAARRAVAALALW